MPLIPAVFSRFSSASAFSESGCTEPNGMMLFSCKRDMAKSLTWRSVRGETAMFSTTKRIISLLAVLLSPGFSFCNSPMARSPRGVAAFPSPKRFAVTFIEIAQKASLFLSKSGKTAPRNGDRSLRTGLVKPDSSAIFAMPLQNASAPVKDRINSTLSDAPSRIPSVRAEVLLEKNAVTMENKTMPAHNEFIIGVSPKNGILFYLMRSRKHL